jgi:uncharacterized protein YbjQ (UPF0145 family)
MAEDTKKDDLELEGEEGQGTEDQNNKDEAGKTGADDEGGTGAGGSDKPAGKTFTQEQVTKMMTKEKNQGRAAAMKELGIDPKDTKAMAMVKALLDSQKTDEQKDAEKLSAEAAALAEAEQRAIKAEAKAEAMQLGVQPKFVEDVVTLALSKLTDDGDLKTLIGELKIKYPVWFEESEEDDKDDKKDKKKVGQKGTGSSIKDADKKKGAGDEEKGLGARLAAQRKSAAPKSSYWGNAKK